LIERVLEEDAAGFSNAALIYFGTYFPTYGRDISMMGIEFFEDYDVNGNGQLDAEDIGYWNSIGRYDISLLIEGMLAGTEFMPPPAPQYVEYWATDSTIQFGYSKDFELTDVPNGQWMCTDEGDSSMCYTDPLVCGRVNDEYLDNVGLYCNPCGNSTLTINETTGLGSYSGGSGGAYSGRSDCVAITMKSAKVGSHKIIKDNIKPIKYFTDGTSTTLKGSDIYTSSLSDINKKYYYGVTDGDPDLSKTDTQFYISWGHYAGSGSVTDDNNIKGASEAIYKQYASLVLENNLIDDGFLISSGSDVSVDNIDGNRDEYIYVLNFKQSRFKDQIQEGTWTLTMSGSSAGAGKTIQLTDNSKLIVGPLMTSAGRRFDIISGSSGSAHTGYTGVSGRYGFLYPDAGIMIFGEKLGDDFKTTTSPAVAVWSSGSEGNNQLYPLTSSNSDAKNALRFINAMGNNDLNETIKVYGEKEVTDVTYLCTVGSSDFNHTNNFSILDPATRTMLSDQPAIRGDFSTAATSSAFTEGNATSTLVSGSDAITTTIVQDDGDNFVWPGSNISTMDGNPHVFISGITLWDSFGIPVANATLSTPLLKSFDREVVIKVKLQF
jgi:hypothetical protein